MKYISVRSEVSLLLTFSIVNGHKSKLAVKAVTFHRLQFQSGRSFGNNKVGAHAQTLPKDGKPCKGLLNIAYLTCWASELNNIFWMVYTKYTCLV